MATDSEAVGLFVRACQCGRSELRDHRRQRRCGESRSAVDSTAFRSRSSLPRHAFEALTVEQIAERLDDRFRLLTGGSRTVMPRHQTLRAAIEWSFDLLPEQERIVLWRLSVFAGPFTLEAAEAVAAAGDVETSRCSTTSAGWSRSRSSSPGRDVPAPRDGARLARERSLEAGESEGAYARHRDWYLEFVRTGCAGVFSGPESAPWLDRLEAEHDNLRAALAWSINEPGGAQTALELVAGAVALLGDPRLSDGGPAVARARPGQCGRHVARCARTR